MSDGPSTRPTPRPGPRQPWLGEPLSTIEKAGRQLVCEDDADYSLTPSADAGTAEVVGAGRLM